MRTLLHHELCHLYERLRYLKIRRNDHIPEKLRQSESKLEIRRTSGNYIKCIKHLVNDSIFQEATLLRMASIDKQISERIDKQLDSFPL